MLRSAKDASSVTFKVLLEAIVSCAAIIAALHLGPNIVKVEAHKLKEIAEQIRKQLAESDIPVTEAESRQIAEELLKFADSKAKLGW